MSSSTSKPAVPAEVFKAYDIRGIVYKTLTTDLVYRIGQALATLAKQQDCPTIVIGRDGRLSGPDLAGALTQGIISIGINVIDIGCVPTPVTYFAAHQLNTSACVSVTGSHNPPEYNGLKMVIAGNTLYGESIQDLRKAVEADQFVVAQVPGTVREVDVIPDYIKRISSDIHLSRPMKVVVDCGNGVAGAVAAPLFSALGCEIVPLFCDVDGNFPNHHPDPSKPENLEDVVAALKTTDAEVGLAFDGDGDRLGVVTKSGEVIFPDRQLMLFAADVLTRVPGGQILYDVKCTRLLASWIRQHGGEPLMWNTGHALIKAKLKQTKAPLAGEMSGHVFFNERWYGFDDGMYAAARLLEILSRSADANEPLRSLPNALSTPELNIPMAEGEPFKLVEKLAKAAQTGQFASAVDFITIDGVRVEYADGFGLARPSNTTPVVVLRFEADNPAALERIKAEFRQAIAASWQGIVCPF